MVLGAELLVDWIKHAFILKFNEIPADVSNQLHTDQGISIQNFFNKIMTHLMLIVTS